MIKSIILGIFILILVPAMLGRLILPKKGQVIKNNNIRYLIGFLGMYGLFTVLYIPAVICRISFHRLSLAVVCVLLVLVIIALIQMRNEQVFTGISQKIRRSVSYVMEHKLILFMLAIIGYQVVRLILGQVWQYRDDKTYIAMVNDMISSDKLYGVDDITGARLLETDIVSAKFVLASWYPFEAFLSYVMCLKPLILCKTVLPAVILIIEYKITWLFGDLLFAKEEKKTVFTIACALLYEATHLINDQAMIAVLWPAWGKNIVAMICIPLFLIIFFYMMEREKILRDQLILLLIVLTGCGASNMGIMMLPIEGGLLTLIWAFRTKKIKNIVRGAMTFMPVAVAFLALYVLLTKNVISVRAGL